MTKFSFSFLFLISVSGLLVSGCSTDPPVPYESDYPDEIEKIIVSKCAVSGCHNNQSYEATAGLNLTTWEDLFKGSRNHNAAVIPYRSDQSFLLFSVNTFDDLGPKLNPVMPLNQSPLSREEVILLKNWISSGAPGKNGTIKFSGNPERKKIYVANQGCDLISVFDREEKIVMRCFDAGSSVSTEAPHDMMVSPDGKHLYISFFASGIFQKFSTENDTKTGEINLGEISWHSMAISGNSRYAIVSHLDASGVVSLLDLEQMKVVWKYQGAGLFIYPHGCAMNYEGTMAYIVCQQGNFLYKVDLTNPSFPDIREVLLQPGEPVQPNGKYKPYEVDFSPDNSMYFVTCQGTNELRAFNASDDKLIYARKTTGVPQLVSFSEKFPYLFLTCMEDSGNAATSSGVDIFNYKTGQLLGSVFTGYQPRGIAADDDYEVVYVGNRNITPVGWAPHHTTACGGRNGYITLIDMNTLQLVPGFKAEVSVDPYSLSIRK